MTFRRSAKITRDIKMEFTLAVDCIVGLPTTGKNPNDPAPSFHITFSRGEKIKGRTDPFKAVVDQPRAQDMLPDGLGKVAPTVAEVNFQTHFSVTLQKKTEFAYKPKSFHISVVDTQFNVGIVGGELNLGAYVDREYLQEKTFEVMNRAEDKCLIFTLKAEPQKEADDRRKEEKAKAKAQEKERAAAQKKGDAAATAKESGGGSGAAAAAAEADGGDAASRGRSPTRGKGSPRSRSASPTARGGSPRASPRSGSPTSRAAKPAPPPEESSDDEFSEILDSHAAVQGSGTPRKESSQAYPNESAAPPPATATEETSAADPPQEEQHQQQDENEEEKAPPPRTTSGLGPPPGSLLARQRQREEDQKPAQKQTQEQPATQQRENRSEGETIASGAASPTKSSPKQSPKSSPRSSPRGQKKASADDDEELHAIVDAAETDEASSETKTDRRHQAVHGGGSATTSTTAEPSNASGPSVTVASAPPAEEEPSSDDEVMEAVTGTLAVREDNSSRAMVRKHGTIITRKDEKGIAPAPTPPADPAPAPDSPKDSSSEEDDEVMTSLRSESRSREDQQQQRSAAAAQPPTQTKQRDPSKRASLLAKNPGTDVVDQVTVRVTGWIRETRSSSLLNPPETDHMKQVSKRQSLSPKETTPLPYTSQLILHILHNARVANNELSQYVYDFLNNLLFDEVLRHSRHYGMWIRILLHVIDEIVLYYYPGEEDLPAGADLVLLEEEQQFFSSTLGEIIKEKDAQFSEAQQNSGDHVKYLLENALHRQLQPPGLRPNQRWEVEETDEDHEDRIFLHALMVIDCATVLQQLVALASDRVDSLLQFDSDESFSFAKRTEEDKGDIHDVGSSTTSFLFSVSRNHVRKILATPASDPKKETDGKKQLFSTELGAIGWLPTLLTELNALYIQLSYPRPVGLGSTADIMKQAAPGGNAEVKKASPRAHGLIVEVIRSVFFNINCSLINRMHHRRPIESEVSPDTEPTEKKSKKKKSKNKKAQQEEKESKEEQASLETMHLRSAHDAMNLKLTVSALEQWLTEHDLYSECRKELLQLRQVCDLFILPKSIFVDVKTRIDVCGLVSEELMFHGLHQFVVDEKEIVPDEVPANLLETLAQSIAARKGIRATEPATGNSKDNKAPTSAIVEAVAAQVGIPCADPIPLNFVLVHLDNVISKYKTAANNAAQRQRNEESRAIQDSLEWDVAH